ncbi:cobalamin B12-binding domain-containing protein [Roseospira navarrensis]|uniref:cobalamin B12-binding domain-containing protein n=1 Tax=Roseospira navarrensis TaxID=140058 RepID=UPI001478B4EC|nr:cobalamin B12-binding domain-containing protein [Roseospira navarrensis]
MASVIEGDVIPRLVSAYRHGPAEGAPLTGGVSGEPPRREVRAGMESTVDLFVRHILRGENTRALALVREMEERGVSFEALCADLLEPAAARIEAFWSNDAYDFSDLTVALSRLQWILHEMERDLGQDEAIHGVGHRVLLAAVPAERHTFGISLVSAMFHRAGWDVSDALIAESRAALLRLVAEDTYPVIGLWVCRPCQLAGLTGLIDELRRGSLNPCLRVLLVGPPCRDPETLAKTGADAVAETALTALERAEDLLADALEQD